MNEKLMKASEVCNWLNISRYKLHKLVQSGELPAFKLGKTYRFRREDVEAYLERSRTDAEGGHKPTV